MLEQEAHFDIHELFFSKTDLKGIIQSGNAVFIRVSEFSEDELMKRPHNIIRHQDMPRSVFRLFWSFLKKNKPVAAYVKNKSKNGKYYWVFAMAFPLQDGYLSVRLKPTSSLFSLAKQLYQKIIYMEDNGSTMDQGITAAEEILRQSGYTSYESFMMTALLQELISRDSLMQISTETTAVIRAEKKVKPSTLLDLSIGCTLAARESFSKMRRLSEKLQDLIGFSKDISAICQKVKFVTLNLTVSSAKLGELGRPLVAVSGNLEKLTSEISDSSSHLQETFEKYEKTVLEMHVNLATARFQIEMMNQLANEVCQSCEQCTRLTDDSTLNFRFNCRLLSDLITRTLVSVGSTSSNLLSVTKDLLSSIHALSKTVNGMRVIHVVGKIEVARTPGALKDDFPEMEGLTENLKDALETLKKECGTGLAICEELDASFGHISSGMGQINKMISPSLAVL